MILDAKLHEQLRNKAHKERCSIAELIRVAIDEYLKEGKGKSK
jgi:predicted HicB family RNase H-like nuclease